MTNETVPQTFSFARCLPHLLEGHLLAPLENKIEIGTQTKISFTFT